MAIRCGGGGGGGGGEGEGPPPTPLPNRAFFRSGESRRDTLSVIAVPNALTI
jgi:hypothetical protein